MNTTSRAGWLAVVLLCTANSIFSQSSVSDDLQRADKQFNLYAYNLALKTYKQVLDKDANNASALAGIADCYFQLNKPEESLSWYERAVEQRSPNSDVQLRYGKALMIKGDYAQARRQFLEYAAISESTQQTGRHYVNMCDYAIKTAGQQPAYTAKNEPVNTEASDFGPAILNNRVVYSSARTDIARKTTSKSSSDWSGSAYNQLFVTQRNPENGYLQKPAFLRSDLQNAYNEGPVSYSTDGKRVAFCRNNFINGTRQIADKGVNMSLYIADVVDGEWVNVKPFPYNGTDYATGFPSLSSNGNTLLFSSNNPNSTTGGKGWDIYVSTFVNGEWGAPRNLGAPLNTQGNEVTPFYDGTDLYFSSDWHNGLGGLDVFRAELGKNEVTNVYHLGPGVNSSFDDYGFVFNSQQKVGYLVSNRPGGRGNEDIWQVTKKGNDALVSGNSGASSRSLSDALAGRAPAATASNASNDAFSPTQYSTDGNESTIKNYHLYVGDSWGRPLPGVDVDMSDCNGEKGQTDTEGKYYFYPLNRPVDCTIELSKEGYESASVDVKEFGAHNIVVAIGLDKRQEFSGTVLDARTNEPLKGAVVEFKDKGKSIQTSTDFNGKYVLDLTPRTTYDIEYSNEGYKVASLKVRPGMPGTGNEIAPVLLEPSTTTSSFSAAGRSLSPASTAPTQYSTNNKPTTQYYSPSGGQQSQSAIGAVTAANKPTVTLIPARQPDPEPEFNGYSIQLSATPENINEGNAQKYESLAKYGNIYTKSENSKNKVRLGIYQTKDEAQQKLKEVNKDKQFKGAFIVEERGADNDLIVGKIAAAPTQYSTTATMASKSIAGGGNTAVRYAVQLGSFSPDKPIAIGDYAKIAPLGNIYTKLENGMNKVRLGVWNNHDNAEVAQTEVINRGFKDAIVVTEKAGDENIKGFMISDVTEAQKATEYSVQAAPKGQRAALSSSSSSAVSEAGAKYYVRVCALKDVDKFDADQLEAAGVDGKVEKWPVGNTGMTAIMLAGYANLEAANSDKEKLRFSGFPDAYIVKELKGEVSKVR